MTDMDNRLNDPTIEATDPARQDRLVQALRATATAVFEADEPVECIETHISWLFLAGPWVYKLKKAVDLGFLNFRTLQQRHFFCQEELRLNRRFAPDLYVDVIPVTGTPEHPRLDGAGAPIDWMVKMWRFHQSDRLDHRLAAGNLNVSVIDELATTLAAFHTRIAAATDTDDFGTPRAVWHPVQENFLQIGPLLQNPADRADLDRLREWTTRRYADLRDVVVARKRQGLVRECHGDLHLANIALVDDKVTLFDCLEFNAALRWTDVMSDVAFLMMDLQCRERDDLAQRFLNGYLERTGDYAGLRMLDFYRVYRALVRAKVACLGLHQLTSASGPASSASPNIARCQALLDEYHRYIALAKSFTQRSTPVLLIAHGLSGSGKTTGSAALLELIGAVRIRSDIERKRLGGLPALARTRAAVGADLYAADATTRTYAQLLTQAQTILAAGYSVFVDATFLQRSQRDAFRRLADRLHIPFWILDFVAEEPLLRARIARRTQRGDDASEANLDVFEHQLATQEVLADAERGCVFRCDAQALASAPSAPIFWAPLLQRLGDSPRIQ